MSSKSKPVYITIDSMPIMPRFRVSKGYRRNVSLHKAQQWCLSDKDKEALNSIKRLMGFTKNKKENNNK